MTNRTAPRTPFEIRLELLELARVILQNECDAKSGVRSAPSVEDIIAHAEKMNAFVSKAQNNQPH